MRDTNEWESQEMSDDEVESIFASFLRNARRLRPLSPDASSRMSKPESTADPQDTFDRDFDKMFNA